MYIYMYMYILSSGIRMPPQKNMIHIPALPSIHPLHKNYVLTCTYLIIKFMQLTHMGFPVRLSRMSVARTWTQMLSPCKLKNL